MHGALPRSPRGIRAGWIRVGWTQWSSASIGNSAVLAGARLIATNQDPTFPSPTGPLPGAGSFVAAVAYASGASPIAAGKPEEPAARLLAARASEIDVAIGDRPSTDGAFARRLSARFGLVLTGVTPHGHGDLDPSPDLEADDLLALVNVFTKP